MSKDTLLFEFAVRAFLSTVWRVTKKMEHPSSNRLSNKMATTPPPDVQKHHQTPLKAKIQGAVEFCEMQGIDYYKKIYSSNLVSLLVPVIASCVRLPLASDIISPTSLKFVGTNLL